LPANFLILDEIESAQILFLIGRQTVEGKLYSEQFKAKIRKLKIFQIHMIHIVSNVNMFEGRKEDTKGDQSKRLLNSSQVTKLKYLRRKYHFGATVKNSDELLSRCMAVN